MLSQKNTKNANFLCIMSVLKEMLEAGSITAKEYLRAKKYYLKLTGADIFIAD
jgi:membrane peptidoglycan carboxypeptidase